MRPCVVWRYDRYDESVTRTNAIGQVRIAAGSSLERVDAVWLGFGTDGLSGVIHGSS